MHRRLPVAVFWALFVAEVAWEWHGWQPPSVRTLFAVAVTAPFALWAVWRCRHPPRAK
jgi:hypothetical protein